MAKKKPKKGKKKDKKKACSGCVGIDYHHTCDGAKAVSSGEAHTALTDKHHAGLVIRKITKFGFPIYVAIITDDNVDPLDDVVVGFIKKDRAGKDRWGSNSIQDKRDLAGDLIEEITKKFEKAEGIAIILYVDKTCISSLFGDFMNHGMCRDELYFLLNMGTAV